MSFIEDDDGLGSFTLAQVGMKTGTFGGAAIMKFVQGDFMTREGEQIDNSREFISFGLVKVVQKFVGKKLVDTIPVGAHADFPDIEELNNAAPREEWGVGLNGQPQGPYTRVLVLKLFDAETTNRYAFVTSSVGGSIAIGDLADKTKIRRRLQGPNVTPVVTCRSTVFRTSYNPHGKRPHFAPVRWIELKGDQALSKPAEPLKQLSATEAAPTASPVKEAVKVEAMTASAASAAPTAASIVPAAKPIGTPVAEPTRQEELDDKIIF